MGHSRPCSPSPTSHVAAKLTQLILFGQSGFIRTCNCYGHGTDVYPREFGVNLAYSSPGTRVHAYIHTTRPRSYIVTQDGQMGTRQRSATASLTQLMEPKPRAWTRPQQIARGGDPPVTPVVILIFTHQNYAVGELYS